MEETGKIPVLLLVLGGIGYTMGLMFETNVLISSGIAIGTISISFFIYRWIMRS